MNNRVKLLLLFMLGLYNLSFAQIVSEGTNPIPIDLSKEFEASFNLSDSLVNVEALLVAVAWKNSSIKKIGELNIATAEKETVKAKFSWLNHLSASGNLNEITLNRSQNANIIGNQFPRYNFGLFLNLGMFVNNPMDIKISKLDQEKQMEQLRSDKNALKAEVLRRYQNYRMNQEFLKIAIENLSDSQMKFSTNEISFETGNLSLNEYNASKADLNAAKLKRIQTESEYLIAKINLEEILGITLEEILED